VLKNRWILCTMPWDGADDAEPNDTADLPQQSTILCPDTVYRGHLWRPDGPPDNADLFLLIPREDGDIEVDLTVPRDASLDYDVVVWRQVGSDFQPAGQSRNEAGIDERVVLNAPVWGYYWIQITSARPYGKQIEEPYELRWSYR
jgi:hypothetical protein